MQFFRIVAGPARPPTMLASIYRDPALGHVRCCRLSCNPQKKVLKRTLHVLHRLSVRYFALTGAPRGLGWKTCFVSRKPSPNFTRFGLSRQHRCGSCVEGHRFVVGHLGCRMPCNRGLVFLAVWLIDGRVLRCSSFAKWQSLCRQVGHEP